ncbi:MAG: ABC transporter ATP-binding protein/permease [Lachnospiraceae bacterium]|nr:ABC transporter ATP-binding protein/permease [Lachnospiraceae bacterium]
MTNKLFYPGKRLKLAIAGVVIEGMISGCNFVVLFKVLELIFGNTISFHDIGMATLYLGIVFALRLILYSISYTQSQIGGAVVSKDLRVALGDKLRRIPLGAFSKQRVGYYINAATSEVADFEQILTHKLADIIKYSVLMVVVSAYCAYLNIYIGIIMFMLLIILFPTIQLSIIQVQKYGTAKNLAREENVSAITEYLTGSQTLRSYGLAGEKNTALRKSMKYFSNISYRYERAIIPIGFAFMFFVYIGAAISIYIAVNATLSGNLSIPQMIVMVMLSLFSCKVEATLYISLVAYRNLLISKGKIAGIFKEEEEKEVVGNYAPKRFDISFRDVCFGYEKGQKVLDGMSFDIPENRITAIVGDSGSGKSTIFNLLTKYYEPEKGKITVGGEELSGANAEQVLSDISLVDQDVFLFNDTIRNNLLFAAPEASEEEVLDACRKANCSFIEQLPDGIDTVVGENGNKLSGGERQRISVARAILRKSNIVLLDEATSSLDIENELLVKKAVLNLLTLGKTVVMIAHTLPIIQCADRILVIKDGKVVESGNHEELIRENGKYASMWKASLQVK